MFNKVLITAALILSFVVVSIAQVPQYVNYQGMLSDAAGNPLTGNYTIKFRIYSTASGGSPLWGPQTSTVNADAGLFSAELGPIDYSVFDGSDRWLSLQVGSDAEMTPRKRLLSVGNSYRAYDADKLDGKHATAFVQTGQANSVSTNMLQNNAVTASKISPQIVSSIDGVSNDGGNVDLVAGDNVTIAADDANNKITISASGGSGGGDDLGNHTATKNIKLNGKWLSGDGGNEGVYVNNSGRVGIKESSPATHLHVHGSPVQSRGQLSISAPPGEDTFISFYEGSNFKSYLYYDDNNDDLLLQNYNESNGGDLNLNPFGGNVGIGTNSPEGKLHIFGGNAGIAPMSDVSDLVIESSSSAGLSILSSRTGWGRINFGDPLAADAGQIRYEHNNGRLTFSSYGVKRLFIGSGHGNNGTVYIDSPGSPKMVIAQYAAEDAFAVYDKIGDQTPFLIDQSGNVGIGTRSPVSKLDINNGEAGYRSHFYFTDGNTYIRPSSTGNVIMDKGNVGIGTPSPQYGLLELKTTASMNGGLTLYRGSGNTARSWVNSSDVWLMHRGATATRGIAIDNVGRVGIGTNTPVMTLDVRGIIGNNGTVYHSDKRWKKNITNLSGALDNVLKLRGVAFEWRKDEFVDMNFTEGRKTGFIAQEVEAVLPELVTTDANGYKGVEYANITAVLVEAMKELKQENDSLKNDLAQLQNSVAKLMQFTANLTVGPAGE
jgi:hypothetical protein